MGLSSSRFKEEKISKTALLSSFPSMSLLQTVLTFKRRERLRHFHNYPDDERIASEPRCSRDGRGGRLKDSAGTSGMQGGESRFEVRERVMLLW